uniref:Secreted protein n=1 Tax=Heterorhabditis bacteriophora TaxID=37862 RepID=A0A1I7XT44_HETBA
MIHEKHVLSLLCCFITVHSEWEFPFDIGTEFLRVVGGYPTFLDSYFGDLENSTISSHTELSQSVEPMLISAVDNYLREYHK